MASFHRHRRSFGVLLTLGLGAIAAVVTSTVILAQNNQFQLFVAPIDAQGQPVTDLTVKDVAFAEAGAPGKVIAVERFNVPVRVTVNIDNSSSSTQVLAQFREGLTNLVAALPEDVQVALYTTAPQPRAVVEATADRGRLAKGIQQFGPATEAARFSESLIEYAERLERDERDKKLTYAPVLIMLSTPSPEVSGAQLQTVESAIKSILVRGTRFYTAMTATQAADQSERELLTDGRQALIAQQIVKVSGNGRFQALTDWRQLPGLLGEWGKELGTMHTRQTNQFRVVLERPEGASGQINPANLDVRLVRPDVKPAGVSGNGRYLPQ